MKKVLLFAGVLMVAGCQERRASTNASGPADSLSTAPLWSISVADTTAFAQIDSFSHVMHEPAGDGTRIGDAFGGADLYPDHQNPLRFRVDYGSFSLFYRSQPLLIVYPVVKTQSLELAFARADSSGHLIPEYYQEPDTVMAATWKQHFRTVTQSGTGRIASRLLPAGFYQDGYQFYSTNVSTAGLENWLAGRDVRYIYFIPALHTANGSRYITVVLQAEDSQGNAVLSPEGYSYFNYTQPCPPPVIGCK